jgi:hypothetical protein
MQSKVVVIEYQDETNLRNIENLVQAFREIRYGLERKVPLCSKCKFFCESPAKFWEEKGMKIPTFLRDTCEAPQTAKIIHNYKREGTRFPECEVKNKDNKCQDFNPVEVEIVFKSARAWWKFWE